MIAPNLNPLADATLPQTTWLDRLTVGQCAMVLEVDTANEDALRLVAMGLCVGRRVQTVKAGDPMILRVLGARIGLSRRLAATIRVTPCDDMRCQTTV